MRNRPSGPSRSRTRSTGPAGLAGEPDSRSREAAATPPTRSRLQALGHRQGPGLGPPEARITRRAGRRDRPIGRRTRSPARRPTRQRAGDSSRCRTSDSGSRGAPTRRRSRPARPSGPSRSSPGPSGRTASGPARSSRSVARARSIGSSSGGGGSIRSRRVMPGRRGAQDQEGPDAPLDGGQLEPALGEGPVVAEQAVDDGVGQGVLDPDRQPLRPAEAPSGARSCRGD